MESQGKIKVLGIIADEEKRKVANEIIDDIFAEFPGLTGEIYLGYPIYIDEIANRQVCVDIAIITRLGVFIVNILTKKVTNYGEIQDEIYAKVESKFKKHSFLYKKRKLVFDFSAVTLSTRDNSEIEGYPIVYDASELISYIQENKADISEDLYQKILSGIQEAYGINAHYERGAVAEGTRAYAISQMSSLIEKYDSRQMEAILSDTSGIQRIRGMAGSGKTIVLARKAVELHTAHPDWNIVVTYSTRTLKGQLENLIARFYAAKNDGAKYNDKKLKVMQSWGSAKSRGVYYEICLRHDIEPLNVTEAKAKYGASANLFSKICGDLLASRDEFEKMYDCILIDEAQDFDKNYLKLCLRVLGKEERLVYAYDELQKLNEEAMPDPEHIFGRGVDHDTPLTVCYRNQGRAIVTAHAIGMGLYRKAGLLQLPGSPSVWEAIGYVSNSPVVEGKPATLYRTSETSPELLKVDPNQIIDFLSYEDESAMKKALLDMINDDLTKEDLLPRDIMVIDMDTYEYGKHRQELSGLQFVLNYGENTEPWSESESSNKYNFNIHTAGAAFPEDFFRDDSVVYTSIRRAKGNEAFVVYIVNAQKCVNSLRRRSDRNGLFTAITRSKGWVRVLGFGEDMVALSEEFNLIKQHEYKLYFAEYPDKEKQKQIFLNNRDVNTTDVQALGSIKPLIDRLVTGDGVSKLQLMQELFGMSREELIKELSSKSGEE